MHAAPLESDRPLIVYLDFKSPYAYLARGPVAAMARDLGIAVDWRAFVLDIPSYLGSARLDASGKVAEQHRSAAQWSGVKYAYFDCRRYANLRGLTVRGTVKIWDTNLAALGLLWARQQGDAIVERYLDGVLVPFWKRELDVEDPAEIRKVLQAAGADTEGFEDFTQGEGRREHEAFQLAAFDAGIFGVPTFVVRGQVYFGREHLPRIAWHLTGERGPAPDIAYPIPEGTRVSPASRLDVHIDFRSPEAYLALPGTLALERDCGVRLNWLPCAVPFRRPPAPGPSDDRGARHRRFRAQLQAADLERYAPHPWPDVHAGFDQQFAGMGLLWCALRAPGRQSAFVSLVLTRYWRDRRPVDSREVIEELLAAAGVAAEGFGSWASGEGLDAVRNALADARGTAGSPTYVLDDEPHAGRQHLPLIRARLCAR